MSNNMRVNRQRHSATGRRLFRSASWSVSALEPRLLLAADAGAALTGATEATSATPVAIEGSVQESAQLASAPSLQLADSPDLQTQITRVDSVAFVDADLEDLGAVAANLASDTELVLLDPERDLIDQISQAMSRLTGVSQIHLLTHGHSGAVVLGEQTVDSQVLWQRADEIRRWSGSLADGADILVYGCNSGAGDAGNVFAKTLARLTGTDVAASTNVTGASSLGGDWDLELQLGEIEAPLLVSAAAIEQFRGTLNITVNAWGRTGDESFDLLIDDEVVQSWDVEQTWKPYTYVTRAYITADRIKVRFTNDLYQPEIGYDRNLHVDNIVTDTGKFESESEQTFSTGVWHSEDGVSPGFGRGDTLHTNGYFHYDQDAPRDSVEFAGRTWHVLGSANASVEDGVLTVTTHGRNASLWTDLDVEAGDLLNITVNGNRAEIDPGTGAGSRTAYASVGIDFINQFGAEIEEKLISVRPGGVSPGIREVITHADTTGARMWIYVEDRGPDGRNVELTLNDFSVDVADLSADTTPPTVTLEQPEVFTSSTQHLDFIVLHQDNQSLRDDGLLRVTGPNGYDEIAATFIGYDLTDTSRRILYGIFPTHSGNWGPEDNGTYTISLEPNSLFDVAGNGTPGQLLGTLRVNIASPVI